MNDTKQNKETQNSCTAATQKKLVVIGVTVADDRLIITKTSDPEKVRQIMENPMPGRKTVKQRSEKRRGVTYKINSHFSTDTTITERIGNILSDIVSTSDYYRTDAE